MTKIVACGCSITHGAETFNGFMHENNTKNAYPAWIGQTLGVEVENLALSGSGNDDIYHTAMAAIRAGDLHSIIVAWTSPDRLHWEDSGRHWFFIPGWASSMDQDFSQFDDNKVQRIADCNITSDREDLLDVLENQHKFFICNYFGDYQRQIERARNYSFALRNTCENLGIKLVELQALPVEYGLGYVFDPNGAWRQRPGGHPTTHEHMGIAQEIINQYY